MELRISDAEEEIIAPVKKNKKPPKTKKKFEIENDVDVFSDDDDSEGNAVKNSEEESDVDEKETTAKKTSKKQEKVKESKNKNVKSDEEESDNEKKIDFRRSVIMTRSKTGKAKTESNENLVSEDVKTKTKSKSGDKKSEEKNGDATDEITEKVATLNLKTDDSETKIEDAGEKKLTHKEKKKLKKQQEYEKQMETMLKKGGQGHSELDSNFTVSQAQRTAGQLAALENAVDIKVENFSISAKGKDLFVNANLVIAQGRHYGLVGPNG